LEITLSSFDLFRKRKMKLKKYYASILSLLIIGILLGSHGNAAAQMFSVESGTRSYRPPTVGGYIGIEPAHFKYKPSSDVVNNNNIGYSFNDPLYRVRLELQNIDIYFGAGWNLGSQNLLNYYEIGAQLQNVYALFRSRHFIFGVPIRIETNYTQVQSQKSQIGSDTFEQSSGTVGSGPAVMLRAKKDIRLTSTLTVNYGFSVRSLGTSSGSLYALINQNRLYFDHVFNQVGLSLGYDYEFSRYDLTGVRYDYALKGSTIVIGVTF
jgi:hypothetical protein